MIKSIRLTNFKAFKDSGPIDFTNLVCLVGRNSSGKSSIINAVSILKQTFEESNPYSGSLPQLIINGSEYQGGVYEDVVHGHDPKSPIGISFVYETSDDPHNLFEGNEELVNLRIPEVRRGWSRTPLRGVEPGYVVRESEAFISIKFTKKGIFGPTLSSIELSHGNIKMTIRRVGADKYIKWRMESEGAAIGVLDFRFLYGGIFPRIIYKKTRSYGLLGPHDKKKIKQFCSTINYCCASIANEIKSTSVLGPFRTPPTRRYLFSGVTGQSTGFQGEHAANLLIFESISSTQGGHRTLSAWTSYWLRKFNLASGVYVKHLAKRSNVFEIMLKNAGAAKNANFVDVGFGISQVLPVIIQGILMRPGSTFVIQQPELHLHPDAQAEMADFLLFLAKRGIRVVAETHSEYLLIRIRRRMAESLNSEQKKKVSEHIPWNQINISIINEYETWGNFVLRLGVNNKSAQFDNMPKGFMDQALTERMAILEAVSNHGH